MRPEARMAGLEVEVAELRQRLAWALEDVEAARRECEWWEARWREQLTGGAKCTRGV